MALSKFNQTVLELAQSAGNDKDALLYIMDWLNDKDSRCTRTDAKRYLDNARLAELAERLQNAVDKHAAEIALIE